MKYRDLPYTEKEKIVSLVFEEAKRMEEKDKRINYHELSRIVLAKTGIRLKHVTIRSWIIREKVPMGNYKAIRRLPDEDAQIVRGLDLTDFGRLEKADTIRLILNTTKEYFARSVQNLMKSYGLATVRPILISDAPEWMMTAYLDYEPWIHELEKPVEQLTYEEKMKLLSGAISGDGWIAVSHTNRSNVIFTIGLANSQEYKAKMFHQVLESMSIPHSFTKSQIREKQKRIGNHIIQRKALYEYRVTVEAKTAVKHLLTNLKLVEPFKEVKRIIVLKFIKKNVFNRDVIKPVWGYLKVAEKASTIRSQLRACEQIPDEKFVKKNLDKQQILKSLHRRLCEYANKLRRLKPVATRIISDIRSSP